jgi:aldose 1-epimerase
MEHMKSSLVLLTLPIVVEAAAGYTAEKIADHGIETIRLTDAARGVEVSIAPSVGNRAYELKIHGKNLLYFPLADIRALQQEGGMNGVPFLAPWANRIAGAGFWANGKRYLFNPKLGSVRVSSTGIAIHGMLTLSSLWEVTDLRADAQSAQVTSRLPFWKYPELMANWPFAHEYEMTYRLAAGVLEVSTTVTNLSVEPMPLVLGFHPYFQLPDVSRAEASVHLPARAHVETDAQLVATGVLKPIELPDRISLNDHTFDDGFTDLVRDKDGIATFSVQAGTRKIEVAYGSKYPVAIVYAPPNQSFICFEPMTAITNGVNLAQEGKYPGLQSVAPGASWRESFWIRGSGF